MPIKIHDHIYITVAERVHALHEESFERIEVQTEIVADSSDGVVFRAIVTTPKGVFVGHARSDKAARSIEGQSPYEVAETSAVGRALGFAGYGAVDSIASADEVIVAQGRTSTPPSAKPKPVLPVWLQGVEPPWCPGKLGKDQYDPQGCGRSMTYVPAGKRANGTLYNAFWSCPENRENKHKGMSISIPQGVESGGGERDDATPFS